MFLSTHEKFMTVVLSVSRSSSSLLPPPSTLLLTRSIHLETDFQRGCNKEEGRLATAAEGGSGKRTEDCIRGREEEEE